VFDAATPVLRAVIERHRATRIIDLCSGGGGPLLSILEHLPSVSAVLTDLYPNARAFDAAEARLPGRVTCHRESVDATDVHEQLDGVRTIFNALHHFRPHDARKIFADAVKKRQPICAFEVVERRPATVLTVAGTPLAVLALTPFSKPDPARLLFTYALPLIPLATGWDGMASCLRAYGLDELRDVVHGLASEEDGYRFIIDRAPSHGMFPFRVTYVIGEPIRS
jgi:hypothetical protein